MYDSIANLPLPPLPRECSFQKWRAPMLADLRTTTEHYNSLIHTYILICSTYRVHRIYEVFRDASERILSLWFSRHFLKRFNRIANFTYPPPIHTSKIVILTIYLHSIEDFLRKVLCPNLSHYDPTAVPSPWFPLTGNRRPLRPLECRTWFLKRKI
jgi:hypothetical protein